MTITTTATDHHTQSVVSAAGEWRGREETLRERKKERERERERQTERDRESEREKERER